MARVDTAEVCSGAQACDAGYCCSSHGFCGRSPLHCSHSSGCDSTKGSCGVVFLDKQELPHVVPYEALDQKDVSKLVSKLTNEGLHVSPEEKTGGTTMESLLSKGLAEKETMLATAKPAAAAPAPKAAHPLDPAVMDDKKTIADNNKIKTPGEEEKANSGSKLTVGFMGVAFSILPWVL
ncbi:unnamed protein product [Mortierella alpina]